MLMRSCKFSLEMLATFADFGHPNEHDPPSPFGGWVFFCKIMRACVYVDAFNLYYGCLKDTAFKWLDLKLLCQHELPGLQIDHFHVFAARVKGRPNDLSQPVRQQTYFRALATIPNLTIHYGRYVENPVTMPRENPGPNEPPFVRVIKTEEKGSDVNLASHLLLGAFRDEYELGIVMTNDTDLKEPIRIVTQEFRKPVVVLAPMRDPQPGQKPRYIAQDLQNVATFATRINTASLPLSQFPTSLVDTRGATITKPIGW